MCHASPNEATLFTRPTQVVLIYKLATFLQFTGKLQRQRW